MHTPHIKIDKNTGEYRPLQYSTNGEQELQRILNNIDDVIFSYNPAVNRFVYISESCASLYGYGAAQFLDNPQLWREVIVAEDRHCLEGYEQRMLTEGTLTFEYRIHTKSGDLKWVRAKVTPALDDKGVPVRLDVIVRDITQKKLNELALHQANEDLHKLFNTIDEVLFTVDMVSFKLIRISAACSKVYGYQPEDFYSRPNLWSDVVLPEDAGIAAAHIEALARGELVMNQYRIIHSSGDIRWVENKITPTLDENGKLIRLDGVTSNITKRKKAEMEVLAREQEVRRSEANLTAIIENTDADIYSIDRDFKYITFNKSLKDKMMAYAGLEIYPGCGVFEFLREANPEEAAWWRNKYTLAFEGQSVSFVKDFSTAQYQNYVSFTLNPIWENNEVIGLSCFARDITQQRLAEQEIQALNESLEQKVEERTFELRQANAEMESFSYSVSHDLRAPLRIIHGFGQMLKRSCANKLDADETDSLDTMIATAKHMGALIDDLLGFSRLGRAMVVKKPVDLDAMMQGLVEEVKAAYPQYLPAITCQPLGVVEADANLIRQVWVNLISNAVKYSGKKENPTIEIGTTCQQEQTVFFVKDNGAGFDMEYYEKLFAVFQRLHKVTEYEGTGVGLALTQRIIHKHGGHIWAYGKPGEGATFYFTLNAKQL